MSKMKDATHQNALYKTTISINVFQYQNAATTAKYENIANFYSHVTEPHVKTI